MTDWPLIDGDLVSPVIVDMPVGSAAAYARRYGAKAANEDALDIIYGASWCVLVVADGAGGAPRGDEAARLAVESVRARLVGDLDDAGERRNRILDAFEQANTDVQALGVGALTTLAVADIGADTVRAYHAGDSRVLVTGQRGRLKLLTVHHSPTGYMVEAGVLEEREALRHEDSNVVSNLVGIADMRVELGSTVLLARRDSVVVGSDGLFDNLETEEVIAAVRAGPLLKSATTLAQQVVARMTSDNSSVHSKPDDVGFILFRRR